MTLLAALGRVGVGLAGAVTAGAAASRAFTPGLTRREKAAWSLATGLLVQAIALLALLAAGVKPGAGSLLLLEAAIACVAVFLGRGRDPKTTVRVAAPSGPRVLLACLAVVAAGACLVFCLGALSDAMWATDFVAFWGYKGKVIFLSSAVPRRLFQDPALYFAHREYPLLVPFSLAALASFVGEWNDQALALLYPVCAIATLLALSGFLERRVSRLSGALAAALASLCFFLYRPANAGTAEVPFALGLVLVCCAAGDVLLLDRGPGAAELTRLAVAGFFCACLKQEGTLFVFLLAAALWWALRGKPAPLRRLAALALVVPPSLHWVTLYVLRGNQTRRDFDMTLFEPRRWLELPPLFALVVGRMLGTEARQNAVALLAIAAYWIATRRGILDPLAPVFAVQLLCYAAAFSVSSFDPMYAIDGAFRRIVMSLFPAFTLVLCARGMVSAGVTQTGSPPTVSPPNPEGSSSRPSTLDLPSRIGGMTG
jgi:hypothetical protein